MRASALHRKYEVRRTDGSDVAGQEFFVLRIDPASEDEAAIEALRTYADASWRRGDFDLARDLQRKAHEWTRD